MTSADVRMTRRRSSESTAGTCRMPEVLWCDMVRARFAAHWLAGGKQASRRADMESAPTRCAARRCRGRASAGGTWSPPLRGVRQGDVGRTQDSHLRRVMRKCAQCGGSSLRAAGETVMLRCIAVSPVTCGEICMGGMRGAFQALPGIERSNPGNDYASCAPGLPASVTKVTIFFVPELISSMLSTV
jgi:hypothetical protein